MDINSYITNLDNPNEKPLDNIISDAGFCGILRTIGCVGDSLSSGEFETLDLQGKHHYYDLYEYSWDSSLRAPQAQKFITFRVAE